MAGIIEVKDQGKLRIYDADNSNYVDIVAPSTVSSNRTITLPDDSFTVPTSGGVTGITSSSGDIGINTASPASIGSNITTLEITGGSTVRTGGVKISNSDKSIKGVFYGSNSGFSFGSETNNKLTFFTNNTARAELDTSGNLSFNSGFGSVTTVYGVRAWVNFKATDTFAIQGSGGVSSVTDNSTGSYTVNFSTNMPDVNYAAVNGSGYVESTGAQQWFNVGMGVPDDVSHHDITSRKIDNDAPTFASADIQRVQVAYLR